MWLLALVMLADSSHAFPLAVSPAESLQVTEAGAVAAAPVVLIPGLFGSAFAYRKVVPLLTAAGYRTLVIEPLGVGSSGRPEHADYCLTAQADRIAAALDHLGVQRALVIAHQTSASIAYRLAYRRPDLVRGIVSLEGGPAEAAATPGFRRAMQLAPWIKLFGGMRLVRKKIRKSLIEASGDSSWVSDEVVDGYTAGPARHPVHRIGGSLIPRGRATGVPRSSPCGRRARPVTIPRCENVLVAAPRLARPGARGGRARSRPGPRLRLRAHFPRPREPPP